MPVTTIDPTTALVLIDLQNLVVALPTTPCTGPEVVARAVDLADAFHHHGAPVVVAAILGPRCVIRVGAPMSSPPPDSADNQAANGAAAWPISHDLAALRDLVRRHGQQAGLSSHRGDDLVLAVNEAVTNVLDHAGGRGWVRIWADDDFLTVEVADLAGRLGPDTRLDERPPEGPRGYGLWAMRRLCDQLVITQHHGSSQVRLRMKRTLADGGHGRNAPGGTRPTSS